MNFSVLMPTQQTIEIHEAKLIELQGEIHESARRLQHP
jgi:hypothetical protein